LACRNGCIGEPSDVCTAPFITASPAETPDLDADHLPDAWEIAWLGTIHGEHDSDHDGMADFLEYALGTNPASGSEPSPITYLPANHPIPGEFIYPQLAGGSGTIGSTYQASGLTYRVEVSSDLITWHSGPAVVEWTQRRETLPAGMERVGVKVIDPTLSTAPQIFHRVRVTAE
jgi:hypothetical protein